MRVLQALVANFCVHREVDRFGGGLYGRAFVVVSDGRSGCRRRTCGARLFRGLFRRGSGCGRLLRGGVCAWRKGQRCHQNRATKPAHHHAVISHPETSHSPLHGSRVASARDYALLHAKATHDFGFVVHGTHPPITPVRRSIGQILSRIFRVSAAFEVHRQNLRILLASSPMVILPSTACERQNWGGLPGERARHPEADSSAEGSLFGVGWAVRKQGASVSIRECGWSLFCVGYGDF